MRHSDYWFDQRYADMEYAMKQARPRVGVNIDGESEPIGLWVSPPDVDDRLAEAIYVDMTKDELRSLAHDILAALDEWE